MNDMSLFGRDQELQALRLRLRRHSSVLVYGPAGVGKTSLLQAVRPEFPNALYSAESPTINAAFRNIAAELFRLGSQRVRSSCGKMGVEALQTKSATNLKGLVLDALHEGKYMVILDHINRPSTSFAAAIREVLGWAETPVVTAARSTHMEDVGFLQAFYPDRADRHELRNFDSETAADFAETVVQRERLSARNLGELVERVLEAAAGNPGAIVGMLRMSKHPKYRSQESVKVNSLYMDYRMNWKPA